MRKVKLSQIAELNGGSTPRTKNDDYWNGEIVWLSPTDLPEIGEIIRISDSERKITEEGLNSCSAKLLEPGTVIFSSRASIGKIAINDIPVSTNQGFINFTCSDDIYNRFLAYVLKYYTRDIVQLSNSTTFKEVSQRAVKDFEIPLPSLSEQKAIVAKLDRAQRLIDIDKEMLAKYDELIQSVFLEMFGDPVTNPKGWKVKKLGNILDNRDSERIPVKKSDRKEMAGEYPYYGASGILDYVDDYLFEGDHLLIGEDGANLLSRSTVIAFVAGGKYWVNNHAHVLGSDKIELLYYVKYFINNLDLEPYVTGSAQPKLNQGNLNKIEIPMPDFGEVEKFKKKIDMIRKETVKTKASLKKSEELSSSLAQGAFG